MKNRAKHGSDWTRQENGWYTHPNLGGICREKAWSREGAGWYYYPNAESGLDMIFKYGPCKTLYGAKIVAAKLVKIVVEE